MAIKVVHNFLDIYTYILTSRLQETWITHLHHLPTLSGIRVGRHNMYVYYFHFPISAIISALTFFHVIFYIIHPFPSIFFYPFTFIHSFSKWLSSRKTRPYHANLLLHIFSVTGATFKHPLIVFIPYFKHPYSTNYISAFASRSVFRSIQYDRLDDRLVDFLLKFNKNTLKRSHYVSDLVLTYVARSCGNRAMYAAARTKTLGHSAC